MIFGILNPQRILHENLTNLSTSPENVTTLTCEMQKFFIWLKVCCFFSNAGGSEESHLWVVIGGFEKNRLWCGNWNVRQAVSQEVFRLTTFCMDTCFQSFSTLIRRTVHHAGWNSAHVATSRCRKPQHVHINTRAPPVACPRCSTRAMQIVGSTKQQ